MEKFEMEISEETKRFVREMFEAKDVNKTGYFDASELGECLRCVGFSPTDEDVIFLQKHFDKNGDGNVDISELVENLHIVNAHSVHGDDLMEAFKRFDIDGDGYIRPPELVRILTLNDGMEVLEARQLCDYLIRNFDKNHDGKFDYSEFVEICMSGAHTMKPGKKEDT